MIITKATGEYILKMVTLAENHELEINKVCSDCDEKFEEGEFINAERHHGVMRINDEYEWIKTWTLIIGCSGYHEMNDEGTTEELKK